MAKAKHLVGFIDAPVYPGTNPAVAKLTNPSEHPTAKGPPRGPNNSRWRGSSATPKARALHANVSAKSSQNVIGSKLQQSIGGDRLDQKCLPYSNGSRVPKTTAAFKSTTNIRIKAARAWTLPTRSNAPRQTHHEGHHQLVRLPEVDHSCRVWLKILVSILSNDSNEIARVPREKPVRPTVIVAKVMIGLMWPFSRSVLRA